MELRLVRECFLISLGCLLRLLLLFEWHRIVWLHAICTTEDIFACFSSLRALPMAEEYHWLSSLTLQVYISPL